MDTRVLAFSLAISVFTGVLFGLAPAWQATTPDLAGTMKEGGRGSSGGSRKILRDALIVAEVALAFVLLVGSGLMMRSFFTLMNAEMGFDGSNVLTMTLPIARERFPDPDRLNLYLREIMTAVEAVPGVRETAYSCAPPMRGTCYGMPWQVADRPLENKANRQGGFFKIVSASYFSTFRLQLLNGRGLSDRDVKSSPRVLVINERLAKRDFKDANPVGRRLLIEEIIPGKTELGPDIAWEIVGVIRDEKVNGMDDDRSAGVYVSNEQSPAYGGTLSVRGSTNPATLLKSITAAIRSVEQGSSHHRHTDRGRNQRALGCSKPDTVDAARHLRDRRAAARGHRHLRRHLLLGGATHPRNRHPGGAGRDQWSADAADPGPRPRSHVGGPHHWPRRRTAADPIDDDHPVQGRCTRSRNPDRRGVHPCRGCGGRLLRAGSAGNQG